MKLKAEYESMKMSHSKAEKHKNLEELKIEYQHKLEVINEIKREKELRE